MWGLVAHPAAALVLSGVVLVGALHKTEAVSAELGTGGAINFNGILGIIWNIHKGRHSFDLSCDSFIAFLSSDKPWQGEPLLED